MEYPRVTEILRPYAHYEGVPIKVLENAAARGTSVHALCAGEAEGAWIPDSMIPEDLIGYVLSYRRWVDANVSQFIIVEKRYQDHDYKFSGKMDFVIKSIDGELYLVDLKTSVKPQKTYPVQMGAYVHLLEKHDIKVKGAMLVYLDKDGEFPKIDILNDLDKERVVFFQALACWYYFNKGKKNDGP